jgi:hypothetical protein
VEVFHRVHDPRMKRAPAIAEHAAVGHLMRERMLEGVFEIGEQTRLVQKLAVLQLRQRVAEFLVW